MSCIKFLLTLMLLFMPKLQAQFVTTFDPVTKSPIWIPIPIPPPGSNIDQPTAQRLIDASIMASRTAGVNPKRSCQLYVPSVVNSAINPAVATTADLHAVSICLVGLDYDGPTDTWKVPSSGPWSGGVTLNDLNIAIQAALDARPIIPGPRGMPGSIGSVGPQGPPGKDGSTGLTDAQVDAKIAAAIRNLSTNGPSAAPAQLPFQAIVSADQQTLTVGGDCTPSRPCNVRVGSVAYPIIAPLVIRASGTTMVYIDSHGNLTSGPSLPMECIPLWEWQTAVTGPSAVTDRRAVFTMGPVLLPGNAVTITQTGDTVTFSK